MTTNPPVMKLKFITGWPGPSGLPITGGTLTGDLAIEKAGNATVYLQSTSGGVPVVVFHNLDGAANAKKGYIYYSNGGFVFEHVTDAGSSKNIPLYFSADGGVVLSNWTTATRPTGAAGMIGFNTDQQHFEVYTVGSWRILQDNLSTTAWRGDITSATASLVVDFPTSAKICKIRGSWRPATINQNLRIRTSHDSGSSFESGAADYSYGYFSREGTVNSAVTDTNATSVTAAAAVNSADLEFMPFEVTITSAGGTGYSSIVSESHGHNGTNTTYLVVTGFRKSNTAINAVQLFPSSGNIAAMRYNVEFF